MLMSLYLQASFSGRVTQQQGSHVENDKHIRACHDEPQVKTGPATDESASANSLLIKEASTSACVSRSIANSILISLHLQSPFSGKGIKNQCQQVGTARVPTQASPDSR